MVSIALEPDGLLGGGGSLSAYSYTKLFSSITESTVWCEPAGTRLVWITLLAKCDMFGRFAGSVPGLARLANVSLEDTSKALETLQAPDPYSRTPDNEGRRLEVIDGGWRLLNHEKYRDLRDEERRRQQNLEAKRRQREREAEGKLEDDHAGGDEQEAAEAGHVSNHADSQQTVSKSADGQIDVITPLPVSAHASASASATTALKLEEQKHVQPSAARSRFGEFYQVYPRHEAKPAAEKAWKRNALDAVADAIIADVNARLADPGQWKQTEKRFLPLPATYLNGRRWEDDWKPAGRVQRHGGFEERAYGEGGAF